MSDPFRPLQISSCHAETPDIVRFELRSRDGERLPKFEAGAHIDIEAALGLIRQYSLLNDPAENDRYVIGVLKDSKSRGGSIAMHQFKTGDTVNIAGPRIIFRCIMAPRLACCSPAASASHRCSPWRRH